MLFGPKFVTLIFSDYAVKAVSIRPTSSKFKVFFLGKKNLPPGAVVNDHIADPNLFKEGVRAFFLENYSAFRTKKLLLGLNEQELFLTSVFFQEKPKDLREAITSAIAGKIPFDVGEALIDFQEVQTRYYQVVAAKAETIRTLSEIFSDIGFQIQNIVPVPLVFPRLVGSQKDPYIFVSSEDQHLIFCLVVRDSIVFSSSLKLKAPIANSEKEILKVAEEIVTQEYKTQTGEAALRNIFLSGEGIDFLKSFFSAKNYNTQMVSHVNQVQQSRTNLANFNRVLSLSFFDRTITSFRPLKSGATITKKVNASKKTPNKAVLKIIVFLLIIGSLISLLFLSWGRVQSLFIRQSDDAKEQTPPPPAPKTGSPSAKKKTTTPSAKPKVINKKSYKIRVLNGSGKAGFAGSERAYLVSKGYNVVSVGNASNFDHESTIIQTKGSKKEIVAYLTRDLKGRYAITVGSNLAESSAYDVLITLGGT